MASEGSLTLIFVGEECVARDQSHKMHFESKPERSWPGFNNAITCDPRVDSSDSTGRWVAVFDMMDLHQVDRTTAAPTSSDAIQTDGPVKPVGTN